MTPSSSGVDDAAGVLRAAGLRATGPRVAVLDVLRRAQRTGGASRSHLPASEVADRARTQLGALSLQGAYDALDALVRTGLARRIRPADAASAVYEARTGDNHHHVVCRGCGTTHDVDCATGAAPCLTPAAPSLPGGFVLDEAEVVFWGWCAACARSRADQTSTPPHADPHHNTNTNQEKR